MTATCARQDCQRRPTHYVALRVPAVGHDMRNAAKLIVALALCRDHADEFDVPAFVGPAGPGRAMIESTFTDRGFVKPDLDRAEPETRRIGDKPWREFMAHRAQEAGGGQA